MVPSPSSSGAIRALTCARNRRLWIQHAFDILQHCNTACVWQRRGGSWGSAVSLPLPQLELGPNQNSACCIEPKTNNETTKVFTHVNVVHEYRRKNHAGSIRITCCQYGKPLHNICIKSTWCPYKNRRKLQCCGVNKQSQLPFCTRLHPSPRELADHLRLLRVQTSSPLVTGTIHCPPLDRSFLKVDGNGWRARWAIRPRRK